MCRAKENPLQAGCKGEGGFAKLIFEGVQKRLVNKSKVIG